MDRFRSLLPAMFLCLLLFGLYGDEKTYVLKKGETLYRLAQQFSVPVPVLQACNGIRDPAQLRPGVSIKIPASYSIQKGETLYGIARRLEVPLASLMNLNRIEDPATVRAGQRIYYLPPVGGSLPAEAPVAADPGIAAAPRETNLLWPHPGQQETLKGKMYGLLINGNPGDQVVSVSTGRVIFAGPYRGFGRIVFVESEKGYIYVYAGNEDTLVRVGDNVQGGTLIGRLGTSAHAGEARLVFMVYYNGKPIDPAKAPRG